ncbi:class I SAM-dependent methyltransferase [Candidatus Roizmanbacteria bacterium]|nr:MAG: class I SAM-dependent methyltransferase [Candidatus Roizmanbacteria bacterium]
MKSYELEYNREMTAPHNADRDLGSQQHQLASMQYDLRITNLARFLYSKIKSTFAVIPDTHNVIPSEVEGSLHVGRDDDKCPTLLDVGAGNGLFLKFFKTKGFQVAGYELEKELVANMKKDPVLKGDMIEQGDITKLKGKEEYDVVIASDVIEHIKDDVRAIQGLWSFVKPGGMLLITVPGHSAIYGKRDEMWGHFRRYDQKVLLERIDKGISSFVIPDSDRESRNNSGMDPRVKPEDDRNYEIAFATQWNVVGFFVYAFYEKVLHKSINEKMRYSNSIPSRFVRFVLDSILKFEEAIGGVPLGLTQVVGVRKKN